MFPGASHPIPTIQYLFSPDGGMLLATRAVMLFRPGKSSIRSRIPGFSDRGKRMPHPNGLINSVWQLSENAANGSRPVIRTGI